MIAFWITRGEGRPGGERGEYIGKHKTERDLVMLEPSHASTKIGIALPPALPLALSSIQF